MRSNVTILSASCIVLETFEKIQGFAIVEFNSQDSCIGAFFLAVGRLTFAQPNHHHIIMGV